MCFCTRPKAISPTQNRRREIFAKSKPKQSPCCAAKRLAWKVRTTHEATYSIGSMRESDTTPTRSPKRAHRRFSAPPIKSCERDDRRRSNLRSTQTSDLHEGERVR